MSVLVWPNTVPFNAMLISERLHFKSRSKPIKYRGQVLFYNSSRRFRNEFNGSTISEDGLPQTLLTQKAIVGVGYLVNIRHPTNNEFEHFVNACEGVAEPFSWGYWFKELQAFEHPVSVTWPKGVVQGAWVNSRTAQDIINAGRTGKVKQFVLHGSESAVSAPA